MCVCLRVREKERDSVYVRGNEMEMVREETEGERRERLREKVKEERKVERRE